MNILGRQWIWILLGLCVLYGVGVGTRRQVLTAQYRHHGHIVPFTLESALHFRRVQQIIDLGALPEHDPDVFYPEGVNTRETYSVGSEYLHAGVAPLLPESIPLTDRVRWVDVAWFCLGIPCMALWIGGWLRSATAGGVAAFVYAVSIAGVIRSTGQELSRENVALPLLIGHLAADGFAERAASRTAFGAYAVLSSALLAGAIMTWDLIQYYVALWMLLSWFRVVRGSLRLPGRGGVLWCCQFAGLVLAGAANPYLRTHGFLGSPVMLLGCGILLVIGWVRIMGATPVPGNTSRARGMVLAAAVSAIPLAAGLWLIPIEGGSYGHFGELLWAKLRFLNIKPEDPALLSFNQRIMWVPALHSANIGLTITLFPANMVLSIIGCVVLWRDRRFRTDPRFTQLLFFATVSLFSFCFFVRFHVFLALFVSGILGAFAAWALACDGWKRWSVLSLLATGIVVEAGQVLAHPEQWGRPGVYYREMEELTDWLRDHVQPAAVLANFGASSAVLAYGGCPVLLHPKFENEAIRNRVREYGEQLFRGSEESFRNWADWHGAGYYIYGLGEFSQRAPATLQMRYFVDALDPPSDVPARRFEADPEGLQDFRLVWQNRKYRVFRIRTAADQLEAVSWSHAAETEFQHGNLDGAESNAMEALTLDPRNELALKIIGHVSRLREQGFSHRVP